MNHGSSWQFLSACGSPGPLRIGVGPRDGPPTESLTFDRPFLVIGRAPGSDLLLDHWQVSRRHAYLQLVEGRYHCVDLGSRTGTHGGDSAERSGWLEPGRAIRIGPHSVHAERPAPDGLAEAATPSVTWELPGRAIGPSLWRMDRPLVLVGRSPACGIRVVQPDMSKIHCSLVRTRTGVWAVDLLGQNGIFVNEEPVRFARLADGDELRIGRHVFRPRYDAELPDLVPVAGPDGIGLARIVEEVRALASVAPPAGTELAWPPAGLGLTSPGDAGDSTVALLVQQFGLMQQQMFDQFHHTMMMMFEGFAALHREQAGALREEFEKVGDLSREIEALRLETARLARSSQPAGRPEPAPRANGHDAPRPLPPAREVAPAAEPPRRAVPAPPGPEVDIHAQLCSRLASIQTERQNRWQKILGMMSSRS